MTFAPLGMARKHDYAQLCITPSDALTAGFILPGTLTERMTRCGYTNCCRADPPQLHGPYHQ